MNILEKANDFTTKDRNTCYDEPENNFQRIADYWKVHIKHKIELEITRIDKFSLLKNHLYILYELIDWIVDPALVARLCQFIKIGREDYAHNEDNLVDDCGYVRCLSKIMGDEDED